MAKLRQLHLQRGLMDKTDTGNRTDPLDQVVPSTPWHTYHVRNSGTTHWIWQNDGTDFHDLTFDNLDSGNAAGNAEVKNTCDSSYTHQTNLYRKDCNACGWTQWQAIANWGVGYENPCYHTSLVSVHEWYAEHGEGSGETCQDP
jgi:hypothetical protein